MFAFHVQHQDPQSAARCGVFVTPHGSVLTPAFMPVGTQGTVKGVNVDLLKTTGAQIVLANTYHLTLRPGEDIVHQLGGLHAFTGWQGPILTDSGGFQIFSLARITKVNEQGAIFRSHIDGRLIELSPERAIDIQQTLGSDIAMVLDHVVALPSPPEAVRDACDRSVRWAARCLEHARSDRQVLFAIVQGGLDPDLRIACARQLVSMGFPGYAIGGLSVGEPPADMYRMLDVTCPELPEDRPRYLMGVGTPVDLLEAIRRGVDMFDCVIPTRNGRNALALTDNGPLKMRNLKHQADPRPIDANCPCPACRHHSRGYLRHLFMAGEMLGPILVSVHNLTFYQQLIGEARQAIQQARFDDFFCEKLQRWQSSPEDHG